VDVVFKKQQWTRRSLPAACLLAFAAIGCATEPTAPTNTGGVTNAAGMTGTVAGAPSGAAGAAGGAAGGGAPSALGPDFTCGAPSGKAPAELYAAATMAFLPPDETKMLPCAFSSCHSSTKKAAQLNLAAGATLADLVGKVACEAPNLKLVDPSGGDAALSKSWIYLKIAAPVDASLNLMPDASWGTPGACGQMSGYGARMPISGGEDGVGPEKRAIMREWICAGAPLM
jgi:hypothetical protein